MTTTYISHISSTVKGGTDEKLERLNLIVGQNGAGKSTIINTIELACGGFVSDLMGRSLVKKTGDLIVLAQDKKKLTATATFSDKKSASYTVRATPKGAGKAKHNTPFKVRFPFQEVTDNLTGSSAKAREWLMSHLQFQPSLDWSDDLRDALSNTGMPLGLAFSKVIETQKTIIKNAKAEIKGAEKAKELFGSDLQSDLWSTKPTQEEIDMLRTQSSAMMAEIIRSSSSRITETDVERARNTAIAAVEEAQKVEEALATFEGEPVDLSQTERLLELLRSARLIQDYHIETGTSACLACGQHTTESESWLSVRNFIQNTEEGLTSSTVLQREHHNLVHRMNALANSIPELMEKYHSLKREFEQSSPKDTTTLSLEYQQFNAKAEQGSRILHNWSKVSEMNTKVQDQEAVVERAESLLQEGQDASLVAIQNASLEFENSVNKFLQEDYIFKLFLTETTCRIGLHKWGELRFALSGAEWVQIVLAIAAATASEDELSIYIPEERAYDPETLSAMMKALEDVDGQVLLTSTVSPSFVPPTWNTLNLAQPLPF